MKMIDRLAKALHDHWQNGHRPWEETFEKLPAQANDFRAKARAMLKELREPTEEMIDIGSDNALGDDGAKACWQDMIDAILEE